MYPTATLDQALQALAYLLNQKTTPQAEAALRTFFVTAAVQRIFRAFDFNQRLRYATVVTDSTGKASLSALNLGNIPAIDSINDGIRDWTSSYPAGSEYRRAGDYKYWLLVDGTNTWVLNTTQANASLQVAYYDATDIGNTPTTAAALTAMIIAKGALIYYRQSQDPEADTSLEEDQLRQELSEVSEQQERRRPQRQAQSPYDRANHHMGE